MQVIDVLIADDVVFGIRGADIGAAAVTLLRITLPRHGVAPSETERLVQAVLARERETPTLCGAIAIPHGRAREGVPRRDRYQPRTTPRVLIAFLSPEARRAEHLDLLARLARLSRDQAAINAIAAATTAEAVLEVIRERSR